MEDYLLTEVFDILKGIKSNKKITGPELEKLLKRLESSMDVYSQYPLSLSTLP